jgi:Leucine-rich repeat (LRR) protein
LGREIEKLDYVHDDYEEELSCFYFGVGACSIYSINKLGNVTGIYIHGNMELRETVCIPKYIYHLKFLKELSMIYCFIYEIPEELGQLSYLKRINLNSNYIETIPKSLGLLQNLVYIDLCWNPISNVKSNYCFVNKNLVIKIGK